MVQYGTGNGVYVIPAIFRNAKHSKNSVQTIQFSLVQTIPL